MFGGAMFPIWKRGSIASEPEIPIDGKPMFYIDTATRQGMSGAPVFAQTSGFWGPRSAGKDASKYNKELGAPLRAYILAGSAQTTNLKPNWVLCGPLQL